MLVVLTSSRAQEKAAAGQLHKLTKSVLEDYLRANGLAVSGNKPALIKRIMAAEGVPLPQQPPTATP